MADSAAGHKDLAWVEPTGLAASRQETECEEGRGQWPGGRALRDIEQEQQGSWETSRFNLANHQTLFWF